jgi:hypothetical protein
MTQDHGISQPDFKEEVIVPKKREEAKSRYVKFQQLANSGNVFKILTVLNSMLFVGFPFAGSQLVTLSQ